MSLRNWRVSRSGFSVSNSNRPCRPTAILRGVKPPAAIVLTALLCAAGTAGAVEIDWVEPGLVSTEGGTYVTFNGSDFASGMALRLGGHDLEAVVFMNAQQMVGRTPSLSEGFHDAEVLSAGGAVLATLPDAVRAAPPPRISAVLPQELSALGPAPIVIEGENFLAETRFSLTHGDGALVDLEDVRILSPRLITGVASGLTFEPTDPLPFDVHAQDSRGKFTLEGAVYYITRPPIVIEHVEPPLLRSEVGTQVAFQGSGFSADHRASLGGIALTDQAFEDSARLRGTAPPLATGYHRATLSSWGEPATVVAVLQDAVEAAPLPAVTQVIPVEIPLWGGVDVTVQGQHFRSISTVRFGSQALANPVFHSESLITGTAPALPPNDLLPGPRDVSVEDSRGVNVLSGGVTYVGQLLPPPTQIEGSIAEGTLLFEWYNPEEYDGILVWNAEGTQVLDILPGFATSWEIPFGDAGRAHVKLQATRANGSQSKQVDALTSALGCDMNCVLRAGRTGMQAFSLYGRLLEPHVVDRCTDHILNPEPCGDGCGSTISADVGSSSVGRRRTARDMETAQVTDLNRVTTGFTLLEEAQRLEIQAFYQKLDVAFGLRLKGFLRRVTPDGLGFEDVFTFPDTAPGLPKEWQRVVYYRADDDVGIPSEGGVPEPCGMSVPPGDYLLDIYPVGGEPDRPYYVFADDADKSHDPLVFPGSPCPPYPRVRVDDATNVRTLPVITAVSAVGQPEGDGVRVSFTAHGTWTDGAGIHTWPGEMEAAFSCEWMIPDTPSIYEVVTDGTGKLETRVSRWSCYDVQLTIMDPCGRRSKQHFSDVAVVPPLTCPYGPNSFQMPMPDPGGIHGVVGVNRPPQDGGPQGPGTFSGRRPVEFKMLVVPECACEAPLPPTGCEGPMEDDVAIRLVAPGVVGGADMVLVSSLDGTLTLTDECPTQTTGAKYFLVRLEDLGALPALPPFTTGRSVACRFEARTLQVGSRPVVDTWHRIGSSLALTNYPECLDECPWSGTFEERDSSYRFSVKLADASEISLQVESAESITLDLPAGSVEIPEFSNDLRGGLITRFQFLSGDWKADVGTASTSGILLSNSIEGEPATLRPLAISGRGEYGAGAQFGQPWRWCREETLFHYTLEETLAECLLYTGFIGPIPVSVWGYIGLGLQLDARTIVNANVAPFASWQGGGPLVTQDFYLLSNATMYVPCGARADALLGVLSITLRLVPQTRFSLYNNLHFEDGVLSQFRRHSAKFSLDFQAEACLDLFLGEVCYEKSARLINDRDIIYPSPANADLPAGRSWPETAPCGLAAAKSTDRNLAEDARGQGAAAETIPLYRIWNSAPSMAISPDGHLTLSALHEEFLDEEPTNWASRVRVEHDETGEVGDMLLSDRRGELEDPAAVFVSNDTALVAWTRSFRELAGDIRFPPPGELPDPEEVNRVARTLEIVVYRVHRGVDRWITDFNFWLMDDAAFPTDLRADGKASIAAGSEGTGEAIVAWVRYETPDLLLTTGETQVMVPRLQPSGDYAFPLEEAPNTQPQLQHTAVYARRVNAWGNVGPAVKLSPPVESINIEPHVNTTSTGDVTYCVWVHDANHTNLIESNRGRRLLYSRHSGSNLNTWSPPQDVVATPDDFPGILEPAVALRRLADGGVSGFVAFTALESHAAPRDTGWGGANRYVFVSYFEEQDGVPAFSSPVRIHKKCREPTDYATTVEIHTAPEIGRYGESSFQGRAIRHRLPDDILLWHSSGPIGTPMGAGNVRISVRDASRTQWTAPKNLTPEQHILSNASGAFSSEKVAISVLDGGAAGIPAAGSGGGAQFGEIPAYRSFSVALEPDIAIVRCGVENPNMLPGAPIVVYVVLENRGLSSTPVDEGGESVVALRAAVYEEDGTPLPDDVVTLPVPELAPGEATELRVETELMRGPKLVRLEVDPNPVDSDLSNNTCEMDFGVPSPRDVSCEAVVIPLVEGAETGERLVARLTWANGALYDDLLLYRDHRLVAILPPASTSYIDSFVTPGNHTYEVRGRIDAGRSSRVASSCEIVWPAEAVFRRGDFDASESIDITDAIGLLGFLFLGTSMPSCMDAADADDSGVVDITDAIRILSFLFLGKEAPPDPGPRTCGVDPTPDMLAEPCLYDCVMQ